MTTDKNTKPPILQLLMRVMRKLQACIVQYWRRGIAAKFLLCFVALILLLSSCMFGIGQWYVQKHKKEPVIFGATFIPDYARQFDIDPKQTMQAMIDELGIKRFRLVSYWKNIESIEGTYDFTELDWQFEKANAANAKVSLAIGLRQPRWPECHAPEWAKNQDIEIWYPKLRAFMTKVIERYGNNPALDSYQLENEFFLSVFGDCPDFSRWRLVEEFNLVKSLDTNTPVIVSRSNNGLGWPINEPKPDIYGISVYKRIWDKSVTKRYFEYPFPSWTYSFFAGISEITQGKPMIIHELQAEAWLPDGQSMKTAPISELYKSMNPERLVDRMDYAVKSGIKTIDLWGPEWWYHMKIKRSEPALWDTAKQKLSEYR